MRVEDIEQITYLRDMLEDQQKRYTLLIHTRMAFIINVKYATRAFRMLSRPVAMSDKLASGLSEDSIAIIKRQMLGEILNRIEYYTTELIRYGVEVKPMQYIHAA